MQQPTIRDEVRELRDAVNALSARIDRLALIIYGDGVNGIADRVAALEECVAGHASGSLVSRVQSLETMMRSMTWLLKTVLTAVVTTLVVAIVQLVLR